MIDVKELRIGSHYYNSAWTGKPIGRVTSIDGGIRNPDDTRVVLFYDCPYDKDSDPYEGAMLNYLEPVPLTAELLQDIGFACLEQRGSISVWERGDIHICILGERIAARIENGKNSPSISSIRYLHELEAFVYLTTKQELIKEG